VFSLDILSHRILSHRMSAIAILQQYRFFFSRVRAVSQMTNLRVGHRVYLRHLGTQALPSVSKCECAIRGQGERQCESRFVCLAICWLRLR